jgi:hypothetical protein
VQHNHGRGDRFCSCNGRCGGDLNHCATLETTMNLTPWPPSAGERDEQVDGMAQVVEMGTRKAGFEATRRGQWWRGWGAAAVWSGNRWTADDVISSEGDESLLWTPFILDIDGLPTRQKTTRLFRSCSTLLSCQIAVLPTTPELRESVKEKESGSLGTWTACIRLLRRNPGSI